MMSRRGRTRMLLEAGTAAAALLTGAWLVFRGTLYRPAPPPPAAHVAEEAKVDEAIVVAVVGDVVRLSPNGGTSALAAGQRLRADDSVRTGRGGRAPPPGRGRGRAPPAGGPPAVVRGRPPQRHPLHRPRRRPPAHHQAGRGRL